MKNGILLLCCCVGAGCASKQQSAHDATALNTAPTHGSASATSDYSTVTRSPSSKPERRIVDPAPRPYDDATEPAQPALADVRDSRAGTPGVPPSTDAANTASNERDQEPGALTPMDQGHSASDRMITQSIRKAVMKDNSLSFTAKNVKIITADGKVTLRGPVKTPAERSTIEGLARAATGVTQVDDQIEISP